MKLINNLKFILLALVAVVSVSCLDDTVNDYADTPLVMQFSNNSIAQNYEEGNTTAVTEIELPIEYFGGNNSYDKDVTVKIGINASKTTATEGTDFSLPETSVTIPAGENKAIVKLIVNSANLEVSKPKLIALEILESGDISPSESKGSVLITSQMVCSSDLSGNWRYTDIYRDRIIVITKTGVGTYTISANSEFYADRAFNIIGDPCGNFVVGDNSNLPNSIINTNRYGYGPLTGGGTVIDNNTIEITFSIKNFTDGDVKKTLKRE